MLKFLRFNIKDGFTKNVILLAGWAVIAQAINFLLSPIVTRLYTPEDYGILTVYSSILGLLAILGSLKYEFAIVIADDDETSINVAALCLIILLCITLIILFIIFFAGTYIFDKLGYTIILEYKYFIPLGIFLVGLYNISLQWGYRKKEIKKISKTKFIQALFGNFIKIFLGLGNFKATGLITGVIAGDSAGITALSASFFNKDRLLLTKIKWERIKYCAKRYIKFFQYTAAGQLCNQAGLQLPSLLMLPLYDGKTVGYFSLANTVLGLPMSIVGKSIGDAFYAEAASIGRDDPKRLKKLSNSLLKKLFLIGLIPVITILIAGPFLFGFVFGELWTEAGNFARIMAIMIFSRLLFTPVSRLYSVFEKQKEAFIIDFMRVVFILIIYFVSKTLEFKPYIFILLYAVALSFIYFLTFLVAQRIMNEQIAKNERKETIQD